MDSNDPMHRVYLKHAYYMAEKSPDPRTQNGAILVDHFQGMVSGCPNEFPRGVNVSEERWGDDKYHFVEHAERNTIYKAIRAGFSPEGLSLYCPFYACSDCARAIIQTGIKNVIGHKEYMDIVPERWVKSVRIGHQMMREAGVNCLFWSGKIGEITIRVDGKDFHP